jgi:hydrogenase maturation protease
MATTLVLGVGNPLMGDDAVGILAIERLRMRPDLPQQVDLIDGGTEGIGLIPVLERYSRAILVDAIDMSLPPGTIRRFSWQEVRMVSQHQALSLHQSSMADALMLADALDSLPSELVFGGC